jgi:hypothetical protein
MHVPLQARNDSDAAQTETAKTVAQERVLAGNRPEAVAQRKLAEMMNNSPLVLQQRALSDAIHNSPQMVAQRHEMNALFGGAVKPQGDGAMPAEASPAQREEKTNKTGLPNQLKSGVESLSGMSMDHVTVHYNSDKPAQLQAHAFAQGSEIHLGAGQEKHLPHEAWHVVQQAQGRVQPTLQMKAGAVNDDPSLESEADRMGEKAAQFKGRLQETADHSPQGEKLQAIQRMANQAPALGFGTVAQLQRDLDLDGIHVRILDSASRHMTEDEVFAILRSDEVTGEILQASMNGTLNTWNARQFVHGNGYRILCSWQDGMLRVYHSDKGDNYKQENRKTTQDRFDKSDRDGGGGSKGPKSNVYDPSAIPEGYDY